LHSYGLTEGYDKLVVSDIVALLIEALKGIGVADNNLLGAHIKAKSHIPPAPTPPDRTPPHAAASNFAQDTSRPTPH
jgi:hypothetical protein